MCGEKKLSFAYPLGTWGSPPRMRGKGNRSLSGGSSARITPAHAGKRRQTSGPSAAPRDHPRVCGEKVHHRHRQRPYLGSPPRMRGKEHADEIHHLSPGITPACAGKRSCPLRIRSGHGDHPRACGEKEIEVCPAAAARGSPPRMRGKGGKLPGRVRPQGITPAHAGKRRLPQQSTLCRRDHPRVCGEKWHRAAARCTQ